MDDPLLSGDIGQHVHMHNIIFLLIIYESTFVCNTAVGKPNLYISNGTVRARFCIHTSIPININDDLTISHRILSVEKCCLPCLVPFKERPLYPPGVRRSASVVVGNHQIVCLLETFDRLAGF